MTTASVSTLPNDLRESRTGGVSATNVLRQAPQADVVLSEERDSYYAHTLLGESASELTEALLGSRRATILAPEIRVLASYMYFGLTNLAGKQTLGQEYCDIGLAKAGAVSILPSPGSSLRLYAFLRVLVPYLQERLREGWHGLRSLSDPFGRDGAAAARSRARARARAAYSPPAGTAPRTPDDRPAPETRADVHDGAEGEEQGAGAPSLVSFRPRGSALLHPQSDCPRLGRRCFRVMMVFLGRALSWVRRNRPAISGAFEWALRVHLAAFYFDGRYANLAMRAVGARLAYTRAKDEPRSRYAVLGVFTLVQAVGEAASACAVATAGWRATVAAAARARSDRLPRHLETNRGMGEGDAPEEKSASSRVPAVTPEKTPADVALFPRSRRRCSLCMSPRQNAAATPCGHLFCWECIVGWCQTNPECPLCRQPASPQSIVCLYQYA